MPITHGRSYTDIKVLKSLGGLPYTSNISITGTIRDLTTDWKLISPSVNTNVLPHGQLSAPDYVSVASTSNDDNVTGIGARVVVVTGVDENYDLYQELILMNGQTPVQTVNKMIPFELIVLQFGSNVNSSGDTNSVGDIYCGTGTFTLGIPSNAILSILANEDSFNSREAIFIVPDGKIAIFKALFVTAEPDKIENISAIVQIGASLFGFPRTQWFKGIPFAFDGTFNLVPENQIALPARSYIQFRAKATTNKTKTVSIQADFELKDLR